MHGQQNVKLIGSVYRSEFLTVLFSPTFPCGEVLSNFSSSSIEHNYILFFLSVHRLTTLLLLGALHVEEQRTACTTFRSFSLCSSPVLLR